jgi:hypothetical protein
MMAAWAAFASDADPGPGWRRFDPAAPEVMRFGPDQSAMVALDRTAGLACWPRYAA